ncbi:MAG TPA: hypothetical protein VL523_05770 [Terriglobia bacterium]|nr:hypothetical protein [Terriglobia bacterium]
MPAHDEIDALMVELIYYFINQAYSKQGMDETYRATLAKASADLNELTRQEHEISLRKAQLRQTIRALAALCEDVPEVPLLNLRDAIRLAFASAGRRMTAAEVRVKVLQLGFDLAKFKDPLASIHSTLWRLVGAGELVLIRTPGHAKLFEPSENMKTPSLGTDAPLPPPADGAPPAAITDTTAHSKNR